MITCTVHEPPGPAADRLDRAESLVLVRDGFSWSAALFTPFWALAHRLWLVLLAYLGVLVVAEFGLRAVGLNGTGAATAVMVALHILVGLEASSLRRWTLTRRGYAMLASVNGRNLEDCERRFFDAWLPSVPVIRPAGLGPSAGSGPGGGGGASGGGAQTAVPVARPTPISERPAGASRGWLAGWRRA